MSAHPTNDGFNTLVYDAENHAVSVSNTGASAAYTYDANGLRVQKAVTGGTTTVYIFSGSKVIAEYDNGAAVGSPSREYIYSGGSLLAKIESSATVYYHQDGLSTRIMTDSSGNVVTQQGHYPYGELWYQSGTGTKWTFTSYERDAESTNDYAMARYYRNALGRFNSPDPLSGSIGDPQSLNRYSYSRNDPIDLMDPSGMDDKEDNADCTGSDDLSEGFDGTCSPSGGGGGGYIAGDPGQVCPSCGPPPPPPNFTVTLTCCAGPTGQLPIPDPNSAGTGVAATGGLPDDPANGPVTPVDTFGSLVSGGDGPAAPGGANEGPVGGQQIVPGSPGGGGCGDLTGSFVCAGLQQNSHALDSLYMTGNMLNSGSFYAGWIGESALAGAGFAFAPTIGAGAVALYNGATATTQTILATAAASVPIVASQMTEIEQTISDTATNLVTNPEFQENAIDFAKNWLPDDGQPPDPTYGGWAGFLTKNAIDWWRGY